MLKTIKSFTELETEIKCLVSEHIMCLRSFPQELPVGGEDDGLPLVYYNEEAETKSCIIIVGIKWCAKCNEVHLHIVYENDRPCDKYHNLSDYKFDFENTKLLWDNVQWPEKRTIWKVTFRQYIEGQEQVDTEHYFEKQECAEGCFIDFVEAEKESIIKSLWEVKETKNGNDRKYDGKVIGDKDTFTYAELKEVELR